MAFVSSAELLVLHGVRVRGMADTDSVARRFSLDPVTVEDLLLDHAARGWVRRAGFADVTGWTLTEAGRGADSRMLAAELDEAGVRHIVAESHTSFSTLNARFLTLITKWQIRPTRWDPMAANDHSEWRWDEDILKSLAGLAQSVRPVGDRLEQALARFAGYPERFVAAVKRDGDGTGGPSGRIGGAGGARHCQGHQESERNGQRGEQATAPTGATGTRDRPRRSPPADRWQSAQRGHRRRQPPRRLSLRGTLNATPPDQPGCSCSPWNPGPIKAGAPYMRFVSPLAAGVAMSGEVGIVRTGATARSGGRRLDLAGAGWHPLARRPRRRTSVAVAPATEHRIVLDESLSSFMLLA